LPKLTPLDSVLSANAEIGRKFGAKVQ